ncbi:MAG: SDR family oxidoreductase [Chloroflexota bacterium]
MNLEGRVGLVTGGSRGIGRGIALCLARAGADVAVNYLSNEAAALDTQRAIEALGRRSRTYRCDVASSYPDVLAMVEAVAADFGRLDILVNNAGLQAPRSSVCDADLEEFRRVFDSHFWGSVHCSKAAIPHLRRQERSDIIFISSVQVKDQFAHRLPYVAGKMALEGLSSMVAQEEIWNGIRANVIRPGIAESEMGWETLKRRDIANADDLLRKAPFKRIAKPEDIGNAVVFFCSNEGSYITNATLTVDGSQASWIPPRVGA